MPNFSVRVHLIEARDIKGVEDGGSSDPFCVVSCFGQKQFTEKYPKVSTVMFDKVMFFDIENVSDQDFMKETITIDCLDYNFFTSSELIGSTAVGVNMVNTSPDHEIYKTWRALFHQEKTGLEPQGYMKFSISAIRQGEVHAEHFGEEDDDDDMLITIPNVDTNPWTLNVAVFKGDNLPKVDRWGTCDGFVKVTFGGCGLQTDVVKESLNPTWNKELMLPVQVPTITDAIEVSLYDYDWGAQNDFIGSAVYSFRQIQDMETLAPHWVHLYGWPDEVSESELNKYMNANPSAKPSVYKGGLYLSIVTTPDENAKLKTAPLGEVGEAETCQYLLRLQVFQLSEAPDKICNAKVYVEVGFGKESGPTYKRSGKVYLEGKFTDEWLQERTGNVHFTWTGPKIKKSNEYEEAQVPDIFVKLMCGSYVVGTNRYQYNMDTRKGLLKGDLAWHPLDKDVLSSRFVREDEQAGYLQYRLQFGEKEAMGREPVWPVTMYQNYILRAHIFLGKDLPSADVTGMSDPFVKILMGRESIQTSVKEQTLFPRWWESKDMPVQLATNHDMRPDIIAQVFDKDDWGGDDYLGRFTVKTKTIQAKYNPEPEFRDIVRGDSGACGQILCSFQLLRKKDNMPLVDYGPDSIEPQHHDCKVELFVVGLREMEPYGFSSVEHPRLEIDGGDKATTKSTSQGSGPNHSWLEMLTLEMRLPDKSIFAPNLTLRCFDNRSLGEVKVGEGSIPLGPYCMWSDVSGETPVVAVQEGEEVGDPDADEESDEEEFKPKQDYLPTDTVDCNMMIEEEYAAFTFEKRADPEKNKGGSRTMGNVDKTMVDPKDDDDDDDGPKKEKPRQTLPTQWELSTPDMEAGGSSYFGFDGKSNKRWFDQYDLTRGQAIGGGGGMFSFLSGPSGVKKVATLKVRCRAVREETAEYNRPSVEAKHKDLGRDMRMHIRLYVIQGINLTAMDDNGTSDPFLNVELTNHPKVMDKSRTLRKMNNNPMFYVMYEFRDCNMPGDHTLEIEVWDEDFIGDDLIGKARIDVEDRWYSRAWYEYPIEFLKKRPKELVPLWSPLAGTSRGRLELWIDTLNEDEYRGIPAEKLEPPRGEPWELRVVAWKVTDIVFRKPFVDMFVASTLSYKDIYDNKMYNMPRAETDTHWFIDAGEPGVFHWRMIVPCKNPCKEPRLLVQTWDQDLLTPDDSLAECNLALKGLFGKAHQDDRRQKVELNIPMTHPNFSGTQSMIKLDLDLLREEEAKQQPTTLGRDGDEVLMKDFKRPPGLFKYMTASIGLSNPMGAAKRGLMWWCCGGLCVSMLGFGAMSVL